MNKRLFRPWQTGCSITSQVIGRSNMFKTTTTSYTIEFPDSNTEIGQASDEIENLFDDFQSRVLNLLEERDYVRYYVVHDEFFYPIRCAFMSKDNFRRHKAIDTFANVAQSYKSQKLNENKSLKIIVVVAQMPSGSSSKNKNFDHFIKHPSKYIFINNTDQYCLLRAVILAIAYREYVITNRKDANYSKIKYKYSRLNNESTMNSELTKVIKDTNIISTNGLGIESIKILENYYQIQIILLDDNCDLKKPLYNGKLMCNKKFIILVNSSKMSLI